MALRLVDDDSDVEFEIPTSHLPRDALIIQWQRLTVPRSDETSGHAFPARLESALIDLLDWDLKPPTAPQVAFAKLICKQLGVALPSEALNFRGGMHEFLARYAPSFHDRVAFAKTRGG